MRGDCGVKRDKAGGGREDQSKRGSAITRHTLPKAGADQAHDSERCCSYLVVVARVQ